MLISRKNFIWILDILSRLSFGDNFGYKFDLKKRISPCWYRPSFWKKMFFFLCYLPSKLLVWQSDWHLCISGWWGRNRKTQLTTLSHSWIVRDIETSRVYNISQEVLMASKNSYQLARDWGRVCEKHMLLQWQK